MDIKKLGIIVAAMMAVAAFPFFYYNPSAAATSGLSSGFLGMIENSWHLILVLCIGLWASTLERDASVLLPLAFIIMYTIGAAMQLDMLLYPQMRLFILGGIFAFGMTMSMARSRVFFASIILCASVAYHLGIYNMQQLPALASSLHFILGQVLSLALIFAASVSFGLAMQGVLESRKLAPAFASVFWFLP